MQLTELLSVLPFYKTSRNNSDTININGIKMDHREINKNDMFICIKGFTVDGHQFARKAVDNGASVIIAERELNISQVDTIIVPDTTRALAILASRFYNYPTDEFPLIGITGTNGKTTITYILESIFQAYKKKTGLIGTIQMKIGHEAYPIKNTTPDALFLQRIFRDMADEKVDVGIMEVSSHALDLGRVYGCDFDIGIFTNLSQDHLDYHKNMEDYLNAKSLLFSQMGNVYNLGQKYAILNSDDPHSDIIKKRTAQPIMTYSCEKAADVFATDIKLHMTGSTFTLNTPVGKTTIQSHLNGKFNVSNMLAAVSAALVLNVPLDVIKKSLEEILGVSGRFEQVKVNQNFTTIVDYAHTPDSLENVLKTIKEFAERKIYVVVGTGGDRDKTKRPIMAQTALNYADWAIFTSDNPRTEDPKLILNDMTDELTEDHYEVIEDRKQAIYHAVTLANEGDIILIAGKGHETYQEINGVRTEFDDRKIVKEAIKFKEYEK